MMIDWGILARPRDEPRRLPIAPYVAPAPTGAIAGVAGRW